MLLREWKERLKKRINFELKRVKSAEEDEDPEAGAQNDDDEFKTKVGQLFFDNLKTSQIDKFKTPVVKNLMDLFNNAQSIDSIQEWLSYEKFIDLIIDYTSKNGYDGQTPLDPEDIFRATSVNVNKKI